VDADLVIARLAAAQHGAVGRKQLLQTGVPAHVIDHRRDKGLLPVVYPGVYRPAGSPVTWHLRIMAATLAAGPGAVASHRAAAFLHGLEGIEPQAEVGVARARAPRSRGLTVHRLDWLRPSDVELRSGISRTRPAATILALAAVVPEPRLEAALDHALVRGLVSCSQLERRLDAAGQQGRKGAATLGDLLASRRGGPRWTQSEFERRLLRLFQRAGLPLPVPQFEVRLPDGRRAFLDYAWPGVRLALEADSYRHHAGRLAWSRDHTRNTMLVSVGWRILPVTWEDLVKTPAELVALVRRAHAA
jgi:very-short-patch-repair endonuclease